MGHGASYPESYNDSCLDWFANYGQLIESSIKNFDANRWIKMKREKCEYIQHRNQQNANQQKNTAKKFILRQNKDTVTIKNKAGNSRGGHGRGGCGRRGAVGWGR